MNWPVQCTLLSKEWMKQWNYRCYIYQVHWWNHLSWHSVCWGKLHHNLPNQTKTINQPWKDKKSQIIIIKYRGFISTRFNYIQGGHWILCFFPEKYCDFSELGQVRGKCRQRPVHDWLTKILEYTKIFKKNWWTPCILLFKV